MGFLKGIALACVALIGVVVCGLLGLVISALISMSGFILTGALAVALVAHGIWERFQKPKKPP